MDRGDPVLYTGTEYSIIRPFLIESLCYGGLQQPPLVRYVGKSSLVRQGLKIFAENLEKKNLFFLWLE